MRVSESESALAGKVRVGLRHIIEASERKSG